MIEGVVRLNRFGLERGKTWQALVLALAVFLPAILWTQLNHAVPGEAEVPAGTVLVLIATGPPESGTTGKVELTVPMNGGWSTPTGENRQSSVVLVHGGIWVDTTAVAGVEDIRVLFDRQARDLANSDPAMFTTGVKPYTSPSGLKGYTATLTGERYGGSIYVLGDGGVAAVLVARAPLGRLNGETGPIEQITDTLEIS